MSQRGFAIGIERPKTPANVGTLWRSAYNLGAAMVFTVGYRAPVQVTDTVKAPRHIPLIHYPDVATFLGMIPEGWTPVGVELTADAKPLPRFHHPQNAVYVLGPEDGSLSPALQARLPWVVSIPSRLCLNVAVAGSIVLYDRLVKAGWPPAQSTTPYLLEALAP